MKRPDREELIRLREERRMTREDMAMHFKVSVGTVKRWMRAMDIPPLEPKRGFVAGLEKFVGDDGGTSLEHAMAVLGGRVMERIGFGYYLDGKPVPVTEVLAEADRTIKSG